MAIPDVVKVHDFFYENNTAYIVMQYVDGIDLKKYVKRLGHSLQEQEAIELLKPIMTALASLHSKNIVHRDLSPDNIMIDRDGGRLYRLVKGSI